MKPERNKPCPCQSGKKYKKCCYLKVTPEPQKQEDDYDNLIELFQKMELNSRKRKLSKKPHIKKYYQTRRMHGEIMDAMADYHENGKFKPKVDYDINEKNKPTEIEIIENEFDLETREGSQAFFDMIVYKTSSNVNCITEDFIKNNKFRKLEKIELLQSMLNSKLGLFEIIKTDSDEGYVFLKNIFNEDEYKIIDVGLSGSKSYDEMYLYTRIITFEDISFSSGLNLIFDKSDDFIRNFIKQQKQDYNKNGEFLRFSNLYNRYCKHSCRIKMSANKLK